ncbi:esterase/lipase family protein [Inhella sp.]|uniref:esterase/lipase family protein n=1 Tax=Inhella sp. TaxID=1921806 RepID=UPI0035B41C09
MTQPLLQAADLRGADSLSADVVAGLAGLVEALRAQAATAAGATPDLAALGALAQALAPSAGGSTNGARVDALLAWLAPALAAVNALGPLRPEREAVLAALNGVLGDYLATTGHPLAIPMQFRRGGRTLRLERHAMRSRLAGTSPKLVLLVHDLCLNDLHWQRCGHDHGEALTAELGYTPIYLCYNSGLSVSTNGRILTQLLESLCSQWPEPIERLVMIGHGMGGLVARSAFFHSTFLQRGGLRWPSRLNDLITLGTPHRGAPLERAGHGVDLLLSAAPCAAPLSRLGRARSAGIRDLQQGAIRRSFVGDDAVLADLVPLPGSVRCHAVAASLGTASGSLRTRLAGDGLVPVASALGRHEDPDLDLGFAPERQAVVHGLGHLDLMSSAEVFALLRRWLS